MGDKVMAFDHTFHSAKAGTGNGTAMDVGGLVAVGTQVTGINGDTITIEGTIDDSNWVAINAVNLNTKAVGTTITASGLYLIPVTGLSQLRLRISTAGSGTITAKGKGSSHSAGFAFTS